MDSSETKPQITHLERIATQTFASYAAADRARIETTDVRRGDETIDVTSPPVVKRKIIRRGDGTFDLAWFVPVGMKTPASSKTKEQESIPAEPKVHGLRAKDRRRRDRKKGS